MAEAAGPGFNQLFSAALIVFLAAAEWTRVVAPSYGGGNRRRLPEFGGKGAQELKTFLEARFRHENLARFSSLQIFHHRFGAGTDMEFFVNVTEVDANCFHADRKVRGKRFLLY